MNPEEKLIKFYINSKLEFGIITDKSLPEDLFSLLLSDKDFKDLTKKYYPEWGNIKIDRLLGDSLYLKT